MAQFIVLLPGDGVGPEVVAAARLVLEAASRRFGRELAIETCPIGGAALTRGLPSLPPATLAACQRAEGVLLGAVGDPAFDHLPSSERPEGGLLALRKALGVYANLRPARIWPGCEGAGPLKPEVAAGSDLLIVRELTGGLYFGEPRGIDRGAGVAYNTMRYSVPEIERIARVAFEAARRRRKLVTSVDKANVLETSQLWRAVVTRVAGDYPGITVQHMYVDACAMALVTAPSRFDVVLTENLFGDILSDEAAVISGSIGLLPSASIGDGPGLFEPVHGSAPDIAGRDRANPIGAIASAAMLLEHSLGAVDEARAIDAAIDRVLRDGHRTIDLAAGGPHVSCSRMAELVAAAIA
jgi:3-isopropylmalate dehydrogenase